MFGKLQGTCMTLIFLLVAFLLPLVLPDFALLIVVVCLRGEGNVIGLCFAVEVVACLAPHLSLIAPKRKSLIDLDKQDHFGCFDHLGQQYC
jgi:hypothetical protein